MLESLLCQEGFLENSEVIIVDDGSTQPYEHVKNICNSYSNIRYYKTVNKGRAHARNIGVANSRYDLLLFVDDDIIASPYLLTEHIKSQKKENSIVHGKIVNFVYSYPFADPVEGILYDDEKIRLQNKLDFSKFMGDRCKVLLEGYYSILKSCKIGLLEQYLINIFKSNEKEKMWLSFTGGNVSCPKHWIEKIGGFDEGYGLNWGCEDLDLGYRLFLADYPFKYIDPGVVCHVDHRRVAAHIEHKKASEYFETKYNCKIFDEINTLLFSRSA